MFWCFSTHRIWLPRRGDVGSNGRRRSNTTEGVQQQQHDAATDSGVYYLVPTIQETARAAERRAPPRRVPTPSNENWDEATTRGVRTETGGYTRGGPVRRAVLPPLPNSRTTNQVVPRTAPSSAQKPKPPVDAPPPRRPEVPRRTTNETPGFQGRQTEDTIETYGEYAHYMNELERQLGGDPDLALTPGRRDQEAGTRAQRVPNLTTSRISKPTRLGTVVKASGAGVAQPRPQRSLEVVDKRVLEDGPERTVTISTWREQVAEEADQSANLHVYYMDPHDDPNNQRQAQERTDHENLISEEERQQRNLPLRPGRSESRTAFDVGSIRTISDEDSTGSPPISRKRTPTESSESSEHPSPRPLERRLVSESSGSRPSMPWNPTPPQTPPRDVRVQDRSSSRSPNINGINGVGRASPIHSNSSARQTPDGMRLERAHTPMRSSTPNWTHTRPKLSSFHPTRSGSTISTIKSASVIAFENILASCEPPLLHISPALERVGIVTENHLRAIARLSDETRDREIREEALKQGVTVMEWAILLDRLHLL